MNVRLQAAARADTPRNLLAFQRTLKDALIRPLAPGDRTQTRWIDGRPMAEFAETFIKSNDRLTALERLQIYNRMYWFRLIDCFHDDNPGLRAALGLRGFNRLAEAYLTKYPSSSFTLRNLCLRLEGFIRAERILTAPHTLLAIDIARFEWAQTVAFDEPSRPLLTGKEISCTPPARLRMTVQPYVSLLALNHPVDDYVIAVKKRDALRSQSSNASTAPRRVERESKMPRPGRARVFLAVHRLDQRLYYKRLDAPAFKILVALRDGQPLARAIAAGGPSVKPDDMRDWFATWMHLGWLCPNG
ncbi:MAG: putative DNA-binding domain-containing protein [Opitutus sp.]